jgi:hypothetical protein
MPRDVNLQPTFAQIYFYDTDLDYQLQRRKDIFPTLNTDMLRALQEELHKINPFVKSFTNAGIVLKMIVLKINLLI